MNSEESIENGAELQLEVDQECLEREEDKGASELDSKRSWIGDLRETLTGKPSAIMPVDRDAEKYNMSHPRRGKAVIFNHMKFSNGQATRLGTDKDEEQLKVCLKALGFEVMVHRDLKRLELFKTLDKLKDEDHSERDCILIVVLSHGEQDKIYCSDSHYRPEDLWNPFTADMCPTLAGKPKLFFIQACRGDQLDSGTKLSRTQTDSRSIAKEISSYVVPNRADFLVVFSTVEGYYSWRNTQEGSWFVQSLTKVLTAYKETKDLLSMMTIVARQVALNFESNVPHSAAFDQKKQIPMISSTLTRDIHFY